MGLTPGRVVGALLAVYSVLLWIGHRQYIRQRIPFQITTSYQMILATITSISLLFGARIWVLIVSGLTWFFIGGFVLDWKWHARKGFHPATLLLILALILAMETAWANHFGLGGWIAALVVAVVVEGLLECLAFPGV